MLESFIDPEWLASFLPAAEQTEIKVWAVKVAIVWALVEFRTKKRFQGLEDAIMGLKGVTSQLVGAISRVEKADETSTKVINQRLDEELRELTALQKLLQSFGNRVSFIEQKLELETNNNGET